MSPPILLLIFGKSDFILFDISILGTLIFPPKLLLIFGFSKFKLLLNPISGVFI